MPLTPEGNIMYFDYYKFLIKSKNEYSLHSPFLFDFYTKVVKDKKPNSAFEAIEILRKKLLKDDSKIEVIDFGAGSKNKKGNLKKIKEIASNSAKKPRIARFLFKIIRYFDYKTIIDLGTSLGLTTAYQALAADDGRIVSFEGCPNIAQIAKENFEELNLKNIELIVGNIDETLLEKVQNLNEIDFAFFDANHRCEPTIRYFEICLAKAHENSCFVFDDIYWSDEMKAAWQAIKNHPSVMISIDFFWIGLVFFRKKQPKQHFVLRI